MTIELLFFLALLGLAAVPVLAAFRRTRADNRAVMPAIVVLWLGATAAIIAAQFFGARRPLDGEVSVRNRPMQLPADDYIGSAACRSCHPHNHATWSSSYHRTMTQVASETSVLGDFNDVHLAGAGLTVHLKRQGKQFLAELSFSDPPSTGTYPVVMTTGSHTRQAYWLAASDDPRLMILPYMYLRAERRWIPRHSGYINAMCLQEQPELAVFRTDFDRWRTVCIKCHTTHGRPLAQDGPGLSARTAAATQVAEFGISCEACHGPGGEHVRANRDPWRRYQQHVASGPDPTIVNPARLPHDRASEVCGQCHSVFCHRSDEAQRRWSHYGYSYRPGDELAADPIQFISRGRLELMPDRPPGIPDPVIVGSFWRDGMIRASGREYNGLIDSPCFQRGSPRMSCLSCHRMHQAADDPRPREAWADDQLEVGMDANRACLQCHHGRFATSDQLTQHTHHRADSAGSLCYNCHMPFTTYGILKAIRSHQITSPTVAASLQTGRPNACNQCHLDKTLAWTAEQLARRYGQPRPALTPEEQQIAASVLWALRGDAGQRALMAWSFGWADAQAVSGTSWQAPYLAQLLEDRYDAVRYIAQRSLRSLPGFGAFEYDFVGPPAHRAAAHRGALAIWERAKQAVTSQSLRAVFIDEQGRLLRPEFERLWQQRDDRPMAVNE